MRLFVAGDTDGSNDARGDRALGNAPERDVDLENGRRTHLLFIIAQNKKGRTCPAPTCVVIVGATDASPATFSLELIPEILIVNLVVVLQLRRLDDGAEQPGAAIRGCFLEVGVAALHLGAEQLGGPLGVI